MKRFNASKERLALYQAREAYESESNPGNNLAQLKTAHNAYQDHIKQNKSKGKQTGKGNIAYLNQVDNIIKSAEKAAAEKAAAAAKKAKKAAKKASEVEAAKKIQSIMQAHKKRVATQKAESITKPKTEISKKRSPQQTAFRAALEAFNNDKIILKYNNLTVLLENMKNI